MGRMQLTIAYDDGRSCQTQARCKRLLLIRKETFHRTIKSSLKPSLKISRNFQGSKDNNRKIAESVGFLQKLDRCVSHKLTEDEWDWRTAFVFLCFPSTKMRHSWHISWLEMRSVLYTLKHRRIVYASTASSSKSELHSRKNLRNNHW